MKTRRAALVVVAAASVVAAPARAMGQGSAKEMAVARDGKAPFARMSSRALNLRDSLVAMVRAQSGTRYRRGGEDPTKGFDCSGLVQYVLSALKIDLPRTAAQQATLGEPIPKEAAFLRPGDLLTFGKGERITHIGIYVGDGRFVHASTKAGRVIESSLERASSPLVKTWTGARRILAVADDPCTASGACAALRGQ